MEMMSWSCISTKQLLHDSVCYSADEATAASVWSPADVSDLHDEILPHCHIQSLCAGDI